MRANFQAWQYRYERKGYAGYARKNFAPTAFLPSPCDTAAVQRKSPQLHLVNTVQ
jgi:hypothetical protein